MNTQNRRLAGILLTIVIILLIPLVAMQFSKEVNWSPMDFAGAAVLLLGSGLLCEVVLRNVRKMQHRVILFGVILAALLLIWLELAVGIFGTPIAGQ